MLRRIKNKFRKHKYTFAGKTETGGLKYTCAKCKQNIYIPFDWTFRITEDHIKKLKGCTVK